MKQLYYRDSMIGYFEAMSDAEERRMLGPTEAFCKWFDDLYQPCFDPSSVNPGVHERGVLEFESCFSREELDAMARYHKYFISIDTEFDVDRKWDEIVQDPRWQKLTQEAIEALRVFQRAAK